ncbi:MAG: hypothetical protein PUB38_10935 [Prevotella sp.]|nr:hypothetical protein [Prevotella sp.]
MKKKKYIAPQIRALVMERILFSSYSVEQMNGTTTKKIDGGLVIEDKDPDGKTDGNWFENTDNWGGD